MIISCGETWEHYVQRMGKWHRFFCLFPRTVGVDDKGHKICVWLGYCERQRLWIDGWDSCWCTYYRPLNKNAVKD